MAALSHGAWKCSEPPVPRYSGKDPGPIDLSRVVCIGHAGGRRRSDGPCNKAIEVAYVHENTSGYLGIHGWCRKHAPHSRRQFGKS